ncbi:hypothetical protein HN014_18505 [Aquimarina sp. TRL1]|uniref:hypothetical protein n=1 Tax=Aquimarina sp. (strain TRL1) TaxID=2736252 RepID=UPI00158A8E49|nr:hypothetical protein [Aquimarina sp. TRL1]QKX06822.1 hypothetical protein HN014_18505 [Aquimarina sp. TRL1]
MIKTTFNKNGNGSFLFSNKFILLLTCLFMFSGAVMSAKSAIPTSTTEEIALTSENNSEDYAWSRKCVTFKNTGKCATDIYIYDGWYCRFKKRLAPGQTWTTYAYAGNVFRAVEADAGSFNNLKYDKRYKVTRRHSQVVHLCPEYCVDPCDDLTVDAGEDVEVCNEEEVTLSATVAGTTTCTTDAESDCNHTLYKHGGYCSWYYPPSNAAYCGSGHGAKLWTAGGYGTSFVTIDFGKVVPAGTKIHTKMKLKHCSNTYSNKASATIKASLNGDNGFTSLGTVKFSSQYYAEYTYTLDAPARYVKVIDNGQCSFLVDYVRYEIEATTNDTVEYEWSGPGIVGANNTKDITVNKAGNYTVKVKSCDGCEATDTVKVKINNSPDVQVTSVDATCENATGSITFTYEDTPNRTNIELSIDGGNNFTNVKDDSGSYTFDNLAPDTYDIVVRWGNDDCPIELDSVTIIEKEVITVDAGDDQTVCKGDEVVLTASVTGEGQCEECVEYELLNTDYCRGSQHQFVVFINDNGTRRWFRNVDMTWTLNADGTATVKGTVLEYNNTPNTEFEVDATYSGYTTTAPDGSPKGNDCHQEEDSSGWAYYTQLTGTITQVGGGLSYSIGRRGPSFQLGIDANNFEATPGTNGGSGWFTIDGAPDSFGDFNFNFGECITNNTNGVQYQWSTGETTPSIVVSPSEDTTYTVTVNNCGDCTTEDSVTVFVSDTNVSAGDDANIIEGESTTLTATSDNAVSYEWSNGATTASIDVSPTTTTTYTVTATNANGCTATDTVVVTVEPDPCTTKEYDVKAYPIPVEATGILTVDIAVDQDQEVTYETFKMDGNRTGPAVKKQINRGCNTFTIDLDKHCNFLPGTTYILKITGGNWTESIQFMTKQ